MPRPELYCLIRLRNVGDGRCFRQRRGSRRPERKGEAGAVLPVAGILFDKDGTLVDFFATWIPAYRAAADLAGRLAGDAGLGDRLLRLAGYDPATRTLDPDSILAGGTTLEVADLWAAAAGLHDTRKVSWELLQAMEDRATAHPVPVGPGIADLFGRLAGRGLALGVATMDGEAVARATADRLGLSPFLSFLSGYDTGHGSKPAPGMVRGFCAAAGLAPSDIAVVGDTARDMKMARAAGAGLAVGVLTGAAPRANLEDLADIVIGSVLEIESILS